KQGTHITLDGDQYVLGRDPTCSIVIPVTSVSRSHAKIVRAQGRYYVEDLDSRNGTYLNNQAITGRMPLKNNDRIRICDFLAAYHDGTQLPLPPEVARQPTTEEDEPESPSTIEGTLSQSGFELLETQSTEKLRAMLEISTALGKTLELDRLLLQIADSL